MKTKTIFKTLALAMLMPTMLLTTACSSDDNDIVNTENPANIQKGYALPVTVNVTRQGDESTTRASYNESTRMLSFSAGDKLFVKGDHDKAGQFAGTLDYDAVSGKFSGTVTTKVEYPGTADELFTDANTVDAVLLPAGYESYGFYSVSGSGYEANFNIDFNKAFALTKAAAVEQFSFESTDSYSSGFALAPIYAFASFTISGLTANKKVDVSFDTNGPVVISGNVTTSAEGVATFAVGLAPSYLLENGTLTVDGNNIAMPTKTTEAGHIYNISRSVPKTLADVFTEGAVVNVKVNTANGCWFNAAGTYSSGSYTGVTQTNNVGNEGYNKGISMTKDGNNLVVWMKNTFNEITITFNTTNNTYTVTAEENEYAYRMTTFNSIIINGVDITGQLSEYVPPMETITFSSGSGTPDAGETLYTGTHFNVAGSSYNDSWAAFTVNKWNNIKISATDGKTITKVVFKYQWKANLGNLVFSSGTFDGSTTVNNVNASTLTVTSSNSAGTRFSGVTIYYE